MREELVGCYLLSLAGCGEGGALLVGSVVSSAAQGDETGTRHRARSAVPDFKGDPNWVQVKASRLRSTPGGCEVDVTFTNVSDKSLSAGFQYDVLERRRDGRSERRSLPFGRARLAEVSVYNF